VVRTTPELGSTEAGSAEPVPADLGEGTPRRKWCPGKDSNLHDLAVTGT
jgi:hypothetical protein